MDDQTKTRVGGAVVAGIAAMLVGMTSLLAQLAGGEMERRLLHLAWASLILGVTLGSFLGFCWVFVGAQLLVRLGIMDWVAAAAMIGIAAVPLTPKLVKVIEKVLTAYLSGSAPR